MYLYKIHVDIKKYIPVDFIDKVGLLVFLCHVQETEFSQPEIECIVHVQQCLTVYIYNNV